MAEDKRLGERRHGDRRAVARPGPDRRGGDRRLLAAGAVLAAGLAASPAEAQVYTRVRDGVIEATNVPATRDYRLTYPGKGTLIHSRQFRLSSSRYNGQFDSYIAHAAQTYGVSVDLVRAVIQVESEYDHLAVSSKGAQGLMQLMPDTARRFGVWDAFDPRQNIMGGVQYLRVLLDMFSGDVSLAAAGYNAGENAVLRHKGVPPYKETRGYVQKVQALLGAAFSPLVQGVRLDPPALVPVGTAAAAAAARPASRAKAPVRPRIYYKWHDDKGHVHVAQSPPAEGVTYTMIRAVD